MVYVIGLGPGDPEFLPPRAAAFLASGRWVLLRTARHPTAEAPPLSDRLARGDNIVALDDVYEQHATFEAIYDAIIERVLDAHAEHGEVVYAVPGHPLVGEATTPRLQALAAARGVPVTLVGAPSFVDACLEALGAAVTGNLLLLDALTLADDAAIPRTDGPLLLYQVHDRAAASRAKLALMRAGYPDEHVVTIVRAAGVKKKQEVRPTPLFALDRTEAHDHLTSVWVPALAAEQRRPAFGELVGVMARLRAPGGCPWDREQTHASLRPFVIEEAYEVVEAIDGGDPDTLCEELGDLLLQVVFHAQLASEEGVFDIEDVCAGIVEKLVRRHPHVFGDRQVADATEVLANWQAIKATEKGSRDRTSILDGIPKGLPALMRALEVSRRAVKAGFEWPDTAGVLDKVDEEIAELRAEIAANAPADRLADELGDLLFTVVNVARHVGVDPENALRQQMDKFTRRFRHIETRAAEQGKPVEALSLDEMETFWQEAKAHEGRQVQEGRTL